MSNRLSVLTALDKHGKSTYGELEFNTGLTRNFGRSEVFAIYPAGKAIRGAEWKEPS